MEVVRPSWFRDDGKWGGLEWTNKGFHVVTGNWTQVSLFGDFEVDNLIKLIGKSNDSCCIRGSLGLGDLW